MTRFPTKDDFLKAVQQPDSFAAAELRRAEFVLHPVWRIPAPAAGSSAVVFKAVLDGRDQALRFPIRADTSTRQRYDALRDHFAGSGLGPVVAMPRWVDDAIRVDGRTWPVVCMEWVDGRALHHHVEQLVDAGDTTGLGALARQWLELVRRLQDARFAHGDLQHGNVMVDGRGALRLVDFDSSWIERFTGQPPPTETGHHNYQPEHRVWGPWMDTFPGLVVYLSLLTLSRNPTPWRALNTGDNLLFRREDFRPPFRTPAWTHLAAVRDPELDRLAARLQWCCAPNRPADSGLTQLLAPDRQQWWQLVATPGPPPPGMPSPGMSSPALQPPGPPPPSRPGPAPTGDWWQNIPPADAPTTDTPTAGSDRPSRALLITLLVVVLLVVLIAAGAR